MKPNLLSAAIGVRARSVFRKLLIAGVCGVSMFACTDGQVVEITRPDIGKLFWAVKANANAVTLGLHESYRLSVVPVNSSGDTVQNVSGPYFRSTDPSKVSVDSNGVVTGLTVTPGTPVILSMSGHGLTIIDTTIVAVTPQSFKMKTFSFQPVGATSDRLQKLPIQGVQFAGYIATDSNDAPVTNLAVSYRSLDVTVVNAAYGRMTGVGLGETKVIATTTSYGVTFTDTITYKTTYPMTGMANLNAGLSGKPPYFPAVLYIGVNGVITFTSYLLPTAFPTPANITFDNDDLENIEGGNIPALAPYVGQTRKFLVAGTYLYRDTVTGATGKIIVLPSLDE